MSRALASCSVTAAMRERNGAKSPVFSETLVFTLYSRTTWAGMTKGGRDSINSLAA
jgi:hypothetical protein